jgi:hypothetical protein
LQEESAMPFNPDSEDYDAAKRMPEYQAATDAEKYRLAQAAKLIRLVRLATLNRETPKWLN